jgi:hypothetical protein
MVGHLALFSEGLNALEDNGGAKGEREQCFTATDKE